MIYTWRLFFFERCDALFPLSTHQVANENIDYDIDQLNDGAETSLY